MMALESVIAGLRFAPGLPKACATNTPQSTPSAHPVVTTIQPASAAYDLRRVTAAFTPLPSRIRTSVPINSPNQGQCIQASFMSWYCGAALNSSRGRTRQLVDFWNSVILHCAASVSQGGLASDPKSDPMLTVSRLVHLQSTAGYILPPCVFLSLQPPCFLLPLRHWDFHRTPW